MTKAKKAERTVPKTAVQHQFDEITYYVDLRWGEWMALRERIKDLSGEEAQPIVMAAVEEALLHIDGLEDREGNPVEWDGDVSQIPSHHMLKLLAAVSSAQLPAEMMGELPSRMPSAPGPEDSKPATRRASSSSTSS